MFNIPIRGEIDGKDVKIYLNRRYKITTDYEEYEGTLVEFDDVRERFLIKTIPGGLCGLWISFGEIIDMEEI